MMKKKLPICHSITKIRVSFSKNQYFDIIKVQYLITLKGPKNCSADGAKTDQHPVLMAPYVQFSATKFSLGKQQDYQCIKICLHGLVN